MGPKVVSPHYALLGNTYEFSIHNVLCGVVCGFDACGRYISLIESERSAFPLVMMARTKGEDSLFLASCGLDTGNA